MRDRNHTLPAAGRAETARRTSSEIPGSNNPIGTARLLRVVPAVLLLALLASGAPAAMDRGWYALGYREANAGSHKVEVYPGLAYAVADGAPLLADVYRPGDALGPFPGVILIHGGTRRDSDRAAVRGFAMFLASRGFAAAAVDYRTSRRAPWPASLHDVKAAVRWLRANAKAYRVDPKAIGAVGDSAGAFLAAMLGVTGPKDGFEGSVGDYQDVSSAVKAVVAYYGFYDLASLPPESGKGEPFRSLFGAASTGAPGQDKAASPVSFVDKDDPPFMLIHGTADRQTPAAQAGLMRDALEAAGVPVQLALVDCAGHRLARRGGKLRPSLSELDLRVAGFLDEHLPLSYDFDF